MEKPISAPAVRFIQNVAIRTITQARMVAVTQQHLLCQIISAPAIRFTANVAAFWNTIPGRRLAVVAGNIPWQPNFALTIKFIQSAVARTTTRVRMDVAMQQHLLCQRISALALQLLKNVVVVLVMLTFPEQRSAVVA